MTYFPDLTDYAYGNDECDERYLNVGWLEAGQPFATAEVSPLLASALVLCARRPVRLYRGFHTCDLCPGESDVDAPLSIRWQDGPAASLGDGEICVQGPDERWYAAPSLVAHYVIHHEYRPPKGFLRRRH